MELQLISIARERHYSFRLNASIDTGALQDRAPAVRNLCLSINLRNTTYRTTESSAMWDSRQPRHSCHLSCWVIKLSMSDHIMTDPACTQFSHRHPPAFARKSAIPQQRYRMFVSK